MAGLWLPPQWTFSPVDSGLGFQAQHTHHLEVAVERQVSTYRLAARGFRQQVSDQIVTVFGRLPGTTQTDLGRYYVANAGDFVALGWGVGISRTVASRLRGGVESTLVHTSWLPTDVEMLSGLVAGRPLSDRLHDITTRVETDFPETATRVSAAYKMSPGYEQPGDAADGVLDGRFDVQVSQRLPFLGFTNADWEVLVAVRNLFREQLEAGSVYDELLVIRPPKRFVGGLTVRF